MTDPMKVLAELLTGSDAEPVYRHQDIHPIFVEQQKRIAELERRAEAAKAKLATARIGIRDVAAQARMCLSCVVISKHQREWVEREISSEERIALAQIEQTQEQGTPEKFDISDRKNRYAPCPQCKSEFGMGLITRPIKPWPHGGFLAVQCTACGFRGPEVQNKCNSESDKAAFDAWNSIAQIGQPQEPDQQCQVKP